MGLVLTLLRRLVIMPDSKNLTRTERKELEELGWDMERRKARRPESIDAEKFPGYIVPRAQYLSIGNPLHVVGVGVDDKEVGVEVPEMA